MDHIEFMFLGQDFESAREGKYIEIECGEIVVSDPVNFVGDFEGQGSFRCSGVEDMHFLPHLREGGCQLMNGNLASPFEFGPGRRVDCKTNFHLGSIVTLAIFVL